MKTKSTRKNVLISRAYSKNVKALIKKMEKDYIKELSKVNEIVFDASIESQKRITLNKLSDKWFKIFSTVAYKIAMRFLNPLFKTTLMQVKNDVKDNSFLYFDPPYRPISETASFTAYSKFNFEHAIGKHGGFNFIKISEKLNNKEIIELKKIVAKGYEKNLKTIFELNKLYIFFFNLT